MRKPITVITITAFALVAGDASAFKVMPSLNTYNTATIDGALVQVERLKSDGAWFITQNSDFEDWEWRHIFRTLGGHSISEDNPNQNKSYVDYIRIMGKSPDASFCYNETGGLPGGTLLSDEQIDAQYESHGRKPIVCMTRSYGGEWRTETDRCLANPKVEAICLEYVKVALLDDINAPAACIKAVRKMNKRVYILLHAGGDEWTLEENKRIIANLNEWCPKEMASDEVYLVYQDYGGDTQAWFGPGGVEAAIQQACEMPNYTGRRDTRAAPTNGRP